MQAINTFHIECLYLHLFVMVASSGSPFFSSEIHNHETHASQKEKETGPYIIFDRNFFASKKTNKFVISHKWKIRMTTNEILAKRFLVFLPCFLLLWWRIFAIFSRLHWNEQTWCKHNLRIHAKYAITILTVLLTLTFR